MGFDIFSETAPKSITVTRIGETKKGRFSLFINTGTCEEFLFSIDGETLLKNKIAVGTIVTKAELCAISKQSDNQKAKEKAYWYLSLRDYGTAELTKKLLLKFDTDTCAFAVEEMHRLGLLDDVRFAQNRGKSLLQNGKSKNFVLQKLLQLGIERDLAKDTVVGIDTDQLESICKLIEKSYLKKLADGNIDKVVAALLRRGFGISDIKNALSQFEIIEE